jgi:hypothetical protein
MAYAAPTGSALVDLPTLMHYIFVISISTANILCKGRVWKMFECCYWGRRKSTYCSIKHNYMGWLCSKNGRGTIAQDSIEVDIKAEESTRETEEKLDGRNKKGYEREEPA